MRGHELPAFVERAEFLAQAVDRFSRCQRKGSDPLLAVARAADYRQACKAAEVLVGDRRDDRLLIVQQPDAQRLAGQLESGASRRKRPYAGIDLRDIAALRAADHQPVVGPGVRADAQAEYPGSVGSD